MPPDGSASVTVERWSFPRNLSTPSQIASRKGAARGRGEVRQQQYRRSQQDQQDRLTSGGCLTSLCSMLDSTSPRIHSHPFPSSQPLVPPVGAGSRLRELITGGPANHDARLPGRLLAASFTYRALVRTGRPRPAIWARHRTLSSDVPGPANMARAIMGPLGAIAGAHPQITRPTALSQARASSLRSPKGHNYPLPQTRSASLAQPVTSLQTAALPSPSDACSLAAAISSECRWAPASRSTST